MATQTESSDLVVIGAGLMRTGTNSLQLALQQLLDGNCYHMKEVLKNPVSDCKFWIRATEQAPSEQEWRRFYSNYKATVDLPSVAFYKELMEVFPKAKVVLTVRDPHRWHKSLRNTIFQVQKRLEAFPLNLVSRLTSMRHFLPMNYKVMEKLFGFNANKCLDDEERMLVAYQRHVDEVKRHVPADRLLVFEVKDGWEPLCEFLHLPVPPFAFPHVNTTDDFQRTSSGLITMNFVKVGAALVLIGAIGYALYQKEWTMKFVFRK